MRLAILHLTQRAVQYASAGSSSSMHQQEVLDCERWLLSLYSDLLQPARDDPQGELLLHLSKAMAVLQLLRLPPEQRDISEDSFKMLRRQRRVRSDSVQPSRNAFMLSLPIEARHRRLSVARAIPMPRSASSSRAVQLL